MDKVVSCPTCRGKGFVDKQEIRAEPRPDKSIATMTEELCQRCHGTGRVNVPMTNGDCVRAMTDEELARMFTRTTADGCPPEMYWDCAKDKAGWDACEDCWRKWLQCPAEEGE